MQSCDSNDPVTKLFVMHACKLWMFLKLANCDESIERDYVTYKCSLNSSFGYSVVCWVIVTFFVVRVTHHQNICNIRKKNTWKWCPFHVYLVYLYALKPLVTDFDSIHFINTKQAYKMQQSNLKRETTPWSHKPRPPVRLHTEIVHANAVKTVSMGYALNDILYKYINAKNPLCISVYYCNV